MDATLSAGYIARPYRGREDHQMMATVLGAVRRATSDNEVPNAEQFDNTYSNLRAEDCVPTRDAVLVFGQVKSYISAHENSVVGRQRGYTEYISTRAGWRGRGIAGSLLCASLRELRSRGMSEAALGADVDNPAAFELYQRLGFQVTAFEAVYRRPIELA